MRTRACASCATFIVLVAFTSPAQLRVVVRPELQRGTRVRVPVGDTSVAPAVRQATVNTLRAAGFAIVTTEPRQTGESLLVLSARCRRIVFRGWSCTEYAARLVDVASTEVRATATLNPLARPAARLSAIQEALFAGLESGLSR
jgi:hypothetical protein